MQKHNTNHITKKITKYTLQYRNITLQQIQNSFARGSIRAITKKKKKDHMLTVLTAFLLLEPEISLI